MKRSLAAPLLAPALLGLTLLAACAPSTTRFASSEQADTTPDTIRQAAPPILSAFYGLDDALPKQASRGLCPGAAGQDGMPVVFPLELDLQTVQAGDFRITTRSGKVGTLLCVTPAPALDAGEQRTLLMVGQYGSATDQPATVEVTGNLYDRAGKVNFRGQSVKVTPLQDGPTLVLARVAPESEWKSKEATSNPATICPADTVQVVRATWAGGVSRPDGKPVGEAERQAYRVLIGGNEIVPFALADLNDNDNNHDLCLKEAGQPESVSFLAGLLVDPAGDRNPATSVAVQ